MKILIGLREDYLGALQEFAPAIPGILLNRFRLTGLPEENARRAITEPTVLVSEEVKFSTEPFTYRGDALDQMIAAARDEEERSIEPFFLQILCSHVEKQVRQRQASAKPGDPGIEVDGTYLGGEKGIEVLATNFYLDAVNRLAEPSLRDRARQLCEEGLLTNTGRRRNLLKEDIETNFRLNNGSLAILENAHLLRKEPKHGSFLLRDQSRPARRGDLGKARPTRGHRAAPPPLAHATTCSSGGGYRFGPRSGFLCLL